ncbi:MAG: hypothetical protein WA484_14560 [Solirubrobacteraceae bacterium]
MTVIVGVLVIGAGVVFASTPSPSVNDRPAFASNVTQLSATLNGTINPKGDPTSYHFQYGPSGAYGTSIPIPDAYVPVNELDDPVTQVLSGLQPDTTYHFALVANSPAGMSVGTDETFQTPSVPLPAVSTGGASDVTVGSVTLAGSVDPQGWETGYFFEYGPTTSYGALWPGIPVVLGAFTGAQNVVSAIQNLLPGMTYHYRLVANNPAGTSYGTDGTFATLEYPASVIQQTPVLTTDLGFTNPDAGTGKPSGRSLSRAVKLTNALRVCKRKPKKQRGKCEKQAQRTFGPTKKK